MLWGLSYTAAGSSNRIQHVRGESAFSPVLQQNLEELWLVPLLGGKGSIQWKDSGAGNQDEISDSVWLLTGELTYLVCTQV